MAKPNRVPSPEEVEIPCTRMVRVGPERFDVVTGVVRGVFTEAKVLEKSVSLVVGRGTARKSLEIQHRKNAAALGLSVEN